MLLKVLLVFPVKMFGFPLSNTSLIYNKHNIDAFLWLKGLDPIKIIGMLIWTLVTIFITYKHYKRKKEILKLKQQREQEELLRLKNRTINRKIEFKQQYIPNNVQMENDLLNILNL